MTNEEEKPTQEALLGEIAGTLRTIRGWMTFLGIVVLLALIGGCIMATGALGGTGSIVNSWPSASGAGISGLALSGGYLYHADTVNRYVYVTTTRGSIARSFRLPLYVNAVDFTLDVTSLWACNTAGYVYRLNPTTGIINGSWRTPEAGCGIAYGGGQIWCASPTRIYRYTVTGSLFGTVSSGGRDLAGLEYADGYLWAVDRRTWRICQLTEGGSFISSIQRPPGIYGVTRTSDAGPAYIWYTDQATRWVYHIMAGYTPVAPASLGKVKALYR